MCSCGTLPGKLAHVTGADLVYLITMWYRRVGIIACNLCIKPCTHPAISSAPPRPTRQGAEAPEPILSATSMSNADGASEDRTTRMGRGRCLAMPTATAVPVAEATEPMVSDEAGLLYSSAISKAGSMRSRSRKIQRSVYASRFAATGPHGGEDEGRPPSHADVEEYGLLNDNIRQLLLVRVRFVSPPGAVQATHILRHSDWVVRITYANQSYEYGEIVKTVASGSVALFAVVNSRASELHIVGYHRHRCVYPTDVQADFVQETC
jgi:hypothetical protein